MAQALNQTAFITDLIQVPYEGTSLVKVVYPFRVYSKVLGCEITIPSPFVEDNESLPWLRGLCPRAGTIHDAACRKDFVPVCLPASHQHIVMTKKLAADLYMEFLEFGYAQDDARARFGMLHRKWDYTKAWGKYHAVLYWPGYFHQHNMNATYEEMRGA